MKEISPKLAKELLGRIEKLEAWCDARAKDYVTFSEHWKAVSVMAFDIRQHLLWHMQQNNKEYVTAHKSRVFLLAGDEGKDNA